MAAYHKSKLLRHTATAVASWSQGLAVSGTNEATVTVSVYGVHLHLTRPQLSIRHHQGPTCAPSHLQMPSGWPVTSSAGHPCWSLRCCCHSCHSSLCGHSQLLPLPLPPRPVHPPGPLLLPPTAGCMQREASSAGHPTATRAKHRTAAAGEHLAIQTCNSPPPPPNHKQTFCSSYVPHPQLHKQGPWLLFLAYSLLDHTTNKALQSFWQLAAAPGTCQRQHLRTLLASPHYEALMQVPLQPAGRGHGPRQAPHLSSLQCILEHAVACCHHISVGRRHTSLSTKLLQAAVTVMTASATRGVPGGSCG